MPSHQQGPQVSIADLPFADLDGHLRNLILTNPATSDTSVGNGSQIPPSHPHEIDRAALSTIRDNIFQTQPTLEYANHGEFVDSPAPCEPRSPRPGRRRLNQAHRRQMMTELTIVPDSRHQNTPNHQNYPLQDNQPRQHQPVTNFQFQIWPQHVGLSRSRSSWGQPSPTYSSNDALLPNAALGVPPVTYPITTSRQSMRVPGNYRPLHFSPEEVSSQANILNILCSKVLASCEIDRSEIAKKEAFRQRIELISRDVISRYEEEQNPTSTFPALSVELKCFGSLSSGFATKSSDMDLGLVSPCSTISPEVSGSPIPRLLEKALLDAGLGARLLSRTRVPIIKLCESPSEKLFEKLIEEREKWDKAGENKLPLDVGDERGNAIPNRANRSDKREIASASGYTPLSGEFGLSCGNSREVERLRLQQEPKHSLAAYYLQAKRALRRAGGRDVTTSNYEGFATRDWEVLNSVCKAFIQGLFDSSLRERLLAYYRVSMWNKIDQSSSYSLLQVFTQAEGEHIKQIWQFRSNKSTRPPSADGYAPTFRAWEMLQSKAASEPTPFIHTRELQLELDKIKKNPFIQLVVLEQGPHETPSQYYKRAQEVVKFLKDEKGLLQQPTQELAVNSYISGIFDEVIQEKVKNYILDHPEHSTLQGIGCRHKSLGLALELQRALTNDHQYGAGDVADIEAYIRLLYSPLREIKSASGRPVFHVAAPEELSRIVDKIKKLQDLQKVLSNKPREKYRDALEFPPTGVGVQCDINFSAHLALQNTHLLRCYSLTDSRVRPIILFVKQWAKARGINSGYRGTLSSYGFVLMVLHYLVNIARPFVCPNLQLLAPKPMLDACISEANGSAKCKGYDIQFWRNEAEIMQLARTDQLNHNSESIGHLLRGFFEYYAQTGVMSNGMSKGFDWGRDVLSLRTHGGLMTKQEKGWTGAKTLYEIQDVAVEWQQRSKGHRKELGKGNSQTTPTESSTKNPEVKEIRLRYLFAIEDPFELDHNVARTVTHNGIVSIRDEFRRAWKILRAVGNGGIQEDILQDLNGKASDPTILLQLITDIHNADILEAV